ncbi:insulinase family protein [Chitinibacter sp. SCUT-21]|uniref:M16 family metallopeptidase n=1 Tax=Chitinibacter sp. SCUT-21 TaxID=2970891 RepID=UPI0035A57710
MNKSFIVAVSIFSAFSSLSLADKLPLIPHLHSSVKQGQLPNGLRYMIKAMPAKAGGEREVELRLLVNSGSMDELPGERGIAHLIEHMAFRQTKSFPADQLKALLNSNGLRLVNDSNAFTAHENTGYMLKLKQESLGQGLQLMADWANGDVIFDAAALDLERQIVLDEGRLRGNGFRSYLSALMPDSKYLQQMPLGENMDIREVSLDQVGALYRRLYQPQKMTLVVVGDVPKDIEEQIKKRFAKAPQGDGIAQHPNFQPTPTVRMYRGSPPPWPQNEFAVAWNFLQSPLLDAEQVQLQAIAMICMQRRLQAISAKDQQVLARAEWVDFSGMVGRERYLTLYAAVKDEKLGEGLEQLYREIRRAREFGLIEQEVLEASSSLALYLENLPNHTTFWADSLMNAAKLGVATLNVKAHSGPLNTNTINVSSVNAALQQILTTPDQLASVLYSGVTRDKANEKWNDETLAAMVKRVNSEALQKTTIEAAKPLISKEPLRGKVMQERAEQGVTEWTLSNGVKVLLRPQRQADERIGINGRFAGGALALPKELQASSQVLTRYMNLSGIGALNVAEVQQALRNEDMQLFPTFETAQHGFAGDAAQRSLLPMMQTIHLALAQPRSDDGARKTAINQGAIEYKGPGSNQFLYGSAWPFRVWGSLEDFEISLEKLDSLRQQFFGNPAELRVMITGVKDMAQMKDLVERYIASIPAPKTPNPTLLVKPILPKKYGFQNLSLSARIKGSLSEFETANPAYTLWSHAMDGVPSSTSTGFMLEGLADIAKQRSWNVLRENSGDSYEVASWYEISPYFGPIINLQYSADADKCGPAILATAKTLRELSLNSVTDKELKAMHEYMRNGLNNAPKQAIGYAYAQMFHWVNNTDFNWVNPKPEQILSREKVDAAARSWFAPEKWLVQANCKALPDLSELDLPLKAQ